VYDDHRRSGFLDYGLQSLPTLQETQRSAWAERRLWSPGACAVQSARASGVTLSRPFENGRVRKSISLFARGVDCRLQLDGLRVPVLAIEWNLSLRDQRYVSQPGERSRATAFELVEAHTGIRMALSIEPAAALYHFPIETVSESEEGLERTYQGLCVMCLWPAAQDVRLQWTVTQR
jgi:hypothetical protein